MDNVEVKTEDRGYHTPSLHSHSYSGHIYPASSPHGNSSPSLFPRDSSSDRWSLSLDEGRIPAALSGRQELGAWSPSPSPTHATSHTISRRRESNGVISPQTYTVLSPPSRWQGSSYEAVPAAGTGIYSDRSHPDSYDSAHSLIPHHRDTAEPLSPNFGGRFNSSQRLWLSRDDFPKPGRDSQTGGTYAGSATSLSFASHGYTSAHSYGSMWPSNDSGLIDTPSLQSLTPSVRNYEASYSTTSGTISSPEAYSATTEGYKDS